MRKASVALLLFVMVSTAAPAFADYKQAFREGVRSYEKQQWERVVANMSAAIAQNPKTSSALRINITGGWNEPYLPHHFLAAALAQLNECPKARRALRDGGDVAAGDKFRKIVRGKCATRR